MDYNKTFIIWADRYKNEFNQSPYRAIKDGNKTTNFFTPHFIKWVFIKFEETIQRDINYSVGFAGIIEALDINIENYKLDEDAPPEVGKPMSEYDLPEFLKK